MSAGELIARFGKPAVLRRPSTNVTAYGAVERDYTAAPVDITAFIQPRGAGISDLNGAERLGTTCRIYIDGIADVRTDDEIIYPASGDSVTHFRVTGILHPLELTDATYPNIHTIVDAERVSPTTEIAV